MAAKSSGWVGNAHLYIMADYKNRKSYARNSKGFEPIEAYFPSKPTVEVDSDSDSGTEELVQQEYRKIVEAKRKQNAPKETIQPTHPTANGPPEDKHVQSPSDNPDNIFESSNGVETIHPETTVTKSKSSSSIESGASQTTITKSMSIGSTNKVDSAKPNAHRSSNRHSDNTLTDPQSQHSTTSSEYLYSPGKSLLEPSPPVRTRLQPSRLSFGGSSSEGEGNTRTVPVNKTASKSTKAKKRKTIVALPKRKSIKRVAPSVPLPSDSPVSDVQNTEASTQDSVGAVSNATTTSSTISFNPPKTSTFISKESSEKVVTGAKKRKSMAVTRRVMSTIKPARPVHSLEDSDSDSEVDHNETLERLLGGAMNRMQSLQAKAANITNAKVAQYGSKLKTTTNKKIQKPQERKERKSVKSSSASEYDNEKSKKGRKSVRKSTKATSEGENLQKNPKSTKKTTSVPSTSKVVESSTKSRTAVREFDLEPALDSATEGIHPDVDYHDNDWEIEEHDQLSDKSPTIQPTTSKEAKKNNTAATKRKSFLKIRNVSVVLTKTASPDSSQGSTVETQKVAGEDTSTKTKRKRKRITMSKPKSTSRQKYKQDTESESESDLEDPVVEDFPPSLSESDASPHKSHAKGKRKNQERKSTKQDPPRGATQSSESDDQVLETEQAVRSRAKGSTSSGSTSKSSLNDQSSIDKSVLPRLPARKRKKHSRCVLPSKRHKSTAYTKSSEKVNSEKAKKAVKETNNETESESDDQGGHDVTCSPGGRKYRRLDLNTAVAKTPGVRRSQRTRIAPVRPWLNEKTEYDMRRKSGVSLKAVLVPMYDVEDVEAAPKRKQAKTQKPREEVNMVDDDFDKLELNDSKGNLEEFSVVRTLASSDKMDNFGKEIGDETEVIVARQYSTKEMSYGVLTLLSFADKGRCSTKSFEMLFHVYAGRVLFIVNQKEYTVQPKMTVHIPAGSVYNIRNLQRTTAQAFYCTRSIVDTS